MQYIATISNYDKDGETVTVETGTDHYLTARSLTANAFYQLKGVRLFSLKNVTINFRLV